MSVSADSAEYVVLVNREEQYSVWPARRSIPDGWKVEGSPASKETCLSYIRATWTDMRPKSLREALSHEGR
jgi:MbtH protein